MNMSYIDFTIPNQLILFGNGCIIITSGEMDELFFKGSCITVPPIYKLYPPLVNWISNKNQDFMKNHYKLLPTLPSILNFQIYEHELY